MGPQWQHHYHVLNYADMFCNDSLTLKAIDLCENVEIQFQSATLICYSFSMLQYAPLTTSSLFPT